MKLHRHTYVSPYMYNVGKLPKPKRTKSLPKDKIEDFSVFEEKMLKWEATDPE